MPDPGTAAVSYVTGRIRGRTHAGTIHRIDFNWTSDSSGNVVEAQSEPINGFLLMLITKPDGVDVPDSYDVSIEDDMGEDILMGKGAGRSTTETEPVTLDLSTGQPRPAATKTFTFKVKNAGDGKKGWAQLLFR